MWGGRWQQLLKNCPEKLHSEDTDTKAVHLVSREARRHSHGQGYNPRLMSSIWCTPQAPLCLTHIYTLKICPDGHHMHSVMLAIVHSYKLD